MLKKISNRLCKEEQIELFKVIIISEGFQDSRSFWNICNEGIHKLIRRFYYLTPLNFGEWISIYGWFEESVEEGPSIGIKENRTILDSWIDKDEKKIMLNTDKLTQIFNKITKVNFSFENHIEEFPQSIILVITPDSIDGIQYSFKGKIDKSNMNIPYLISTSGKNWHQLILREVYSKIGLGDEYSPIGITSEKPTLFAGIEISNKYFNLLYIPDDQNSLLAKNTKFRTILSQKNQDKVLTKEPNENSIILENEKRIWEGGGGFGKNIYKLFPDCLMRRMIGNNSLPVNEDEIALCDICKKYARFSIASIYSNLNTQIVFPFGNGNIEKT